MSLLLAIQPQAVEAAFITSASSTPSPTINQTTYAPFLSGGSSTYSVSVGHVAYAPFVSASATAQSPTLWLSISIPLIGGSSVAYAPSLSQNGGVSIVQAPFISLSEAIYTSHIYKHVPLKAIALSAVDVSAIPVSAAGNSPFELRVVGSQEATEEDMATRIYTDLIDPSADDADDGVVLIKSGGIWVPSALTMDLIGPAFDATFSGGGTVEDGATITNPSFSATYTSTPTSVTIHDSVNATPANVPLPATSITRTGTRVLTGLGTTWTFTLTATQGAIVKTKTATYTSKRRLYYGAAADGTFNAAFITSLGSSVLVSSFGQTLTGSVLAGQRFVFAYDESMGAPDVTADGFATELNVLATGVSVTNANGVVISYTILGTDIYGANDDASLGLS